MPPTTSSSAISPTIVGSVMRYRRLVILLVVVLAFVGFLYTAVTPKKYSAKAGVAIQPLPASLAPASASVSVHQTPASFLQQQLALLESPEVAEGAAKIVNGQSKSTSVTGTEVQNSLTIKPAQAGTPTTQVIVTMGNAELAQLTANAVLVSYQDALHGQIRQQASQSTVALDAAIAQLSAQLKNIPGPPVRNAHGGTSTTTTTHPKTTTTIHLPPTTTTRAPVTTTTRAPVTTTTKAPATTTTAAALGPPQARLTAAVRPSPAPAVLLATDSTTTTAAGATGSTTTTAGSSSTGSSSSSSSGTPGLESPSGSESSTQAANNASERTILQNSLANLHRQKTQIAVNEQVDLAFSPTMIEATTPTAPANSKYSRNTLLGALAGLVIGVVAAFIMASRRRRFEEASDPELVYAVPLVVPVPAFEVPQWARFALPVITDPVEEPAEAYRSIASALRGIRGEDESLLLLFAAAGLGAGVTTTVTNVGLALAAMGEKVLVVDADPLYHGLTEALLQEPTGSGMGEVPLGFSDFLAGRALEDTVSPSERDIRLSVMPAGRDTDMALDRWPTKVLRSAFEQITEHYGFILVDAPPIGTSSFSMDLLTAAGHAMVIVPHHDLVEPHEDIARRLRFTGAQMVGYIYNGAPISVRYSPYYPMVPSTVVAPLPPSPPEPSGPRPALPPDRRGPQGGSSVPGPIALGGPAPADQPDAEPTTVGDAGLVSAGQPAGSADAAPTASSEQGVAAEPQPSAAEEPVGVIVTPPSPPASEAAPAPPAGIPATAAGGPEAPSAPSAPAEPFPAVGAAAQPAEPDSDVGGVGVTAPGTPAASPRPADDTTVVPATPPVEKAARPRADEDTTAVPVTPRPGEAAPQRLEDDTTVVPATPAGETKVAAAPRRPRQKGGSKASAPANPPGPPAADPSAPGQTSDGAPRGNGGQPADSGDGDVDPGSGEVTMAVPTTARRARPAKPRSASKAKSARPATQPALQDTTTLPATPRAGTPAPATSAPTAAPSTAGSSASTVDTLQMKAVNGKDAGSPN